MDKNKPIKYIIENKIVEGLINDYLIDSFKEDLIQEVYMVLLEHNQKKLQEIIDKKQIRFYIARIIKNMYFSSSSNFYRMYKRPLLLNQGLQLIIDKDNGETEPEES